jgi:hypothetical protein
MFILAPPSAAGPRISRGRAEQLASSSVSLHVAFAILRANKHARRMICNVAQVAFHYLATNSRCDFASLITRESTHVVVEARAIT